MKTINIHKSFNIANNKYNFSMNNMEEVLRFNKQINNGTIKFESVPCLCGCVDFDRIASIDRYGILQETVVCRKCGLIQSNPRMTEDSYKKFYESDQYRKIYDNMSLSEYTEWKYQTHSGKQIFEVVNRIVPLNVSSNVLEIGAGGGVEFISICKNWN